VLTELRYLRPEIRVPEPSLSGREAFDVAQFALDGVDRAEPP
jgi:hypothetical protein